MHIYISHSGNYDYENELYKPIKESELSNVHHFFLPRETENIGVDAKDELKRTDILVAETSYPSTGQGIELGRANVEGIPIVCFHKTGTKPSSSLRFITDEIIEYADIQDLLAQLKVRLTK